MSGVLHKCGLGAGWHGARVLLFVSVLLMNAILPSLVAAAQNTTAPHQMTSEQMDHATMGHAVSVPSQGSLPDHEDHGTSLHCMSSVCCYHEASVLFALVASDAYLTNRQAMDRGSHLPSFLRSTKDRPPQQI
ncbi:hypothetical protein SAMN04488092_102483 [Thalassovita taeanensis]|uniref:DUF2946 domain-containing protein n=1 Tax=Thalassovita taeanensis TaxID=657014 RepID=A0A1H9BEG3_9RHOB|nr:hypothetical protein SAMN04488092_102483 [Thalassovita taeanensis]